MPDSKSGIAGVFTVGEVLTGPEGVGSRQKDTSGQGGKDQTGGTRGEYRVRIPTRSEIMNRALKELGLSAFKIHALLWSWRGAPARGTLPFFTIHSLAKYCNLTRPTVRAGLLELTQKGWIQRKAYNCHHKNALYSLVGIRKVPRPFKKREE